MKETKIILLLLGVLLVVAVISFVRTSGQAPKTDVSSTSVAPPADPDAPSSDNVGHNFILEERKLITAAEALPTDSVAVRELANFYQDAHKLDAAIALYRRYLELNPSGKQEWMDLATCYSGNSAPDSAMTITREVLTRWPDDSQAMYNMGALFANTGNLSEAASWWHKTLESSTDTTINNLVRESLARLANM